MEKKSLLAIRPIDSRACLNVNAYSVYWRNLDLSALMLYASAVVKRHLQAMNDDKKIYQLDTGIGDGMLLVMHLGHALTRCKEVLQSWKEKGESGVKFCATYYDAFQISRQS